MVTQKLVNEEAWYALAVWLPHISIPTTTSITSEKPKMMASLIKEQYPDATDNQIQKAIVALIKTARTKSGYNFE
tara:strand:+ start:1233 stop:1457 length:225 start_codon:yes stop_codon:yes gene_type:complete